MLRHLRITNFAILSDVSIDFGAGMSVLTGETGAGKSLIVDAVALLRGGRASADIPRAGADEAVVEAVFEPPEDMAELVASRLAQAGLAAGDQGEVLVRRVISRGGRSRVHVNGGLTTASALASLGDVLVDLAGQHEHQGLSDPGRHLGILDAFGVEPALSARMGEAWRRLRAAEEALAGADGDERTRAQREEFLRFQVEELDAARVTAGEERELAAERERLRAAGKLGGGARRAETAVYSGDDSVTDVLAGLSRELEPLVAVDPRLDAPVRALADARAMLEDAAIALRRYADGVAEDPERLAEVEDRLHLCARLCKKHGVAGSVELVAARAAMAEELEALSQHESRRAALASERARALAEAEAAAKALHAARKQASSRLERAAGEALGELRMHGARVHVSLNPRELGPHGADRVELLLAANKGEEPRPLAKIASGGELSRIMLALKLALKRADAVATYVFDEVDAGIGGATADAVGRVIHRVARERQVLCVTHLPQIAALADAQYHVEKYEKDGRVETAVRRLTAAERREELARMLGGLKVTAKARAHADELLRRGAE